MNKRARIPTLYWRQIGRDSVSNHQPHDCLLNRLFRRRSKKTPKLRVTGLCAGNSPGTAQMARNTENVSIWWRHHEIAKLMLHELMLISYITEPSFNFSHVQIWLIFKMHEKRFNNWSTIPINDLAPKLNTIINFIDIDVFQGFFN